jgi:hypothetical protein
MVKPIIGRLKINGRDVIDATSAVAINVTPKDITKSKIKDPGCCVMANAIKREYHTEAMVSRSRVYIKILGREIYERFIVSQPLTKEINAFDRGGKFFTGKYTLNPPLPNRRLGAKKPTGPKKTGGKKRATPTEMKGIRVGPAKWVS